LVTLNPGDEIIIPDPYFVLYEYQILLLGGRPVFFDTYPDFTLREDDLRAAFSERTRAILINSPNNPTGAVNSGEELAMVARVAREKNVLVFSDDIYDHFVFDPQEPRTYLGQLYENTLTFGGFSKNWGMTGWRLGYVAGPKEIIDSMVTMQQYVFSSVNSIAQKAALLALDFDTKPLIETFVGKRDLIYDGLKDKFRLAKPLGAYYAFPEAPGGDGDAFVERAIKNRLFIIPGSVFSRKATHFRISFAAGEEAIVKGIEILNSMV
jgi:aspartate aminotransferase/aminotransferase